MYDFQSLAHVKWECKYHIVFTPKYRKKVLYGKIRKRVGQIIRTLAQQKGVDIIEGHICTDHIHIAASIPPKYSVAMIVGFLKGKSAIQLHREFAQCYKSAYGKSFWSRGYFVSTIGRDEEKIKRYIRDQDKKDKDSDGNQLDLGWRN